MRLWHQDLIPHLPRQQLLGQHRECCALRGNAWGKPHSVVNYVFRHSPALLYRYHQLVMDAMARRGYRVDPCWHDPLYRGLSCEPYPSVNDGGEICDPIYPEHDQGYLEECLNNLAGKGITLPQYDTQRYE